MKFTFTLICFLAAWSVQAQSYNDSIEMLRLEHDHEFRNGVLNADELKTFEGICYFPTDTSYIIRAELIRAPGKKFAMPMTKKRDQDVYYKKWGVVRFTLHDTICELSVYENLDLKHSGEYKNYLFLPFRDGTTGHSTYGGGRFIDLAKTANGTIVIDFNTAYHPYCLYSKRYSCPIPPAENTLPVTIPAGECYFGEAH